MKIQFDSTLQYQLDSIGSIVDIFQGKKNVTLTLQSILLHF